MGHPRHWSLGVKLALVGTPFLLLALLFIAVRHAANSSAVRGSVAG
jgi:hypothetical protein